MKDFHDFFLMSLEDVKRYTKEILHFFNEDEPVEASEIGDGNINYVFRVVSKRSNRSVIVKQADRSIRTSGNPLDIYRNKIEANILQLEGELAPGFVPAVYKYDETMAATSMEDVSDFRNLRKELLAGRVYAHLADNISDFLALTLLPTTDLVLDAEDKKKRVKFYTNPQLCRISEDLVLREPYDDYRGRNIITSGNEEFVKEHLYENLPLHAEVGALRESFMNHAQALLHGDLHSGSIFANEKGIKVLDPEFAFYGPMGYDIGNVIGNLFFTLANMVYTSSAGTDAADKVRKTIEDIYDLTRRKISEKYDELVTLPFYRTEGFRKKYLDSVMSDSLGYAGTEIIRRTVGDSKVMELNMVTDLSVKIPMERALILTGISLIMDRGKITNGKKTAETFRIM